MRQALRQAKIARARNSDSVSIPAPVGGWDAVSALADMPPDRAVVLDNWVPTTSDVRVRRGFASHATGMGSGAVESIMVYQGASTSASKMFAAAGGEVYNATSAGAAASVISAMTSNRWQYVNFTTSGGKYLWMCNGSDQPRHWNGTVWAIPALAVTTYSDTDIIHVNAHKNRLWFVFKDSTAAGYLPTGAVAGTVANFEFGGQFTRGGYLVAMATWTRDGGSGQDDYAVFISSEGQVAVYQGTDPTAAETWGLVGVYDIGPPIGRRCFTKVAGDLALVNMDGVVPMSKALGQDRGSTAAIAITANINNAMNEAARSYSSVFGWELTPYPKGTMALLNVPISAASVQHQYVMNTLTGAWCRFTGMNANCWAVFNNSLYFGGNAGVVYKADTGGIDGSAQIDAVGQGAYNYYKTRGQLKEWSLMQPILTADSDGRPAVGISTDFKDNASLGTPTVNSIDSALYDDALYDADVYAIENRTVADWTTISGIGQCAAIHFRATTNTSGDTIMRLNSFNVNYEVGEVL